MQYIQDKKCFIFNRNEPIDEYIDWLNENNLTEYKTDFGFTTRQRWDVRQYWAAIFFYSDEDLMAFKLRWL